LRQVETISGSDREYDSARQLHQRIEGTKRVEVDEMMGYRPQNNI
jgi:hypothetical protein